MICGNRLRVVVAALTIFTGSMVDLAHAADVIRLGLNLPLSGSLKDIGIHSKAGAEMVREKVASEGGLLVGGKRYQVEFLYADNASNVERSVSGALKLISQDQVLGIIGPCASSNAIPVGNISQSFKIPMISPTSTNPKTTANRPFVFRACFLDNFQGEAMARFASREFSATKAAVLYDIDNAYPKGLAEFFKISFESLQGPGSIAAFESFETDASDLSASMKRIVESGAQVLFVPQYAHQLPDILKQAKAAGWDKPVLGGDAWESSELMGNCGDLCKGLFFSSHFGALGATGKAGDFVKAYQAKNNTMPTAFAALAYDSAELMLKAISQVESLSGNLFVDRAAVKEQLAGIKGFDGVSGMVNMNASGDPEKGAVVLKISDSGAFESYAVENP